MKYIHLILPISVSVLVTACVQQRRPAYEVPCEVVSETYIHRYGVEVPCEEWSERGEHGQVISTLGNGVKVTKNISGGLLHGDVTHSFPHHDTVAKVQSYDQNNLVKEVTNYPSGAPMKEVQHISPREEKITVWYENSTPRAIENYVDGVLTNAEYYNYDHKIESRINEGQGKRVSRDAYGLLISTDTIQNGQMISSMLYYPNGSPKAIVPYQNGVVQGLKKTFLPAGEPNTVEQWSAGEQHGITNVYQNGEKLAEVPYAHGKKSGVERRYKNGEKIVEEIGWRNDQQDGPAYTYVEGSVVTNWFYQGRPVNKAMYDKLTSPK